MAGKSVYSEDFMEDKLGQEEFMGELCNGFNLLVDDWDVVNGLVFLHKKEIVHRDLKPNNILINTNELASSEGLLRAKLSDMGLSKRLPRGMTSFSNSDSEEGIHISLSWAAPEIVNRDRQTNAVDLFSLGCVLFFCISGGKHPFGEGHKRATYTKYNKVQVFEIDHIKEAVDVISSLLHPDPRLRPKAKTVMWHPLLWNSKRRMLFLHDVSDKVQLDRKESAWGPVQQGPLFYKIEGMMPIKRWDTRLGIPIARYISNYGKYSVNCTCELLRPIRNMLHHFGELPEELQERLGQIPEGFDDYITNRFPDLLIKVYKVVSQDFKEEQCFKKYFQQ
ncbi:serine/threonine-protein kinase/endoribonuclease IRE1a-like [Tasmannia lanceolata]|uniref:serine/threonine-protein kinase/endoribonuclease IRE1a-like n=1 Tax=Tasmannia lanceolata TaxID=3420 RepID=UPI0040647266